jgi:predicted nuclease of restriction endonuclease-like (RecB) superfamily
MSDLNHSNFYQEIKRIVEQARSQTYKVINFTMVQAYWHIGKLIVEEEQRGEARAEYGKTLLKTLAQRLTQDFGKSFTETNLLYMRQFYLAFPIPHALRGESAIDIQEAGIRPELSWTHYRLLLKVKDKHIRNFYIKEAIDNSWSTRQLERQINSFYYDRILSSQDKTPVRAEAMATEPALTPEDIVKDPYVLEFLSIKEQKSYLERDLEQALIDKLQEFLLELGKGFSFVGRQHRITAEGEHFYIDLVFYNYLLKCFVLIDLKIGKLTHKDIGQMDFYVRYYEHEMRTESDNPTIGIILCSEKNETIVKYSVLEENRQLFASKYKLYLPTEEELKQELEREVLYLKLNGQSTE